MTHLTSKHILRLTLQIIIGNNNEPIKTGQVKKIKQRLPTMEFQNDGKCITLQ